MLDLVSTPDYTPISAIFSPFKITLNAFCHIIVTSVASQACAVFMTYLVPQAYCHQTLENAHWPETFNDYAITFTTVCKVAVSLIASSFQFLCLSIKTSKTMYFSRPFQLSCHFLLYFCSSQIIP